MFKYFMYLCLFFNSYLFAAPSYDLNNIHNIQLINDYWQLDNAQKNTPIKPTELLQFNRAVWQNNHSPAFKVKAHTQGNWYYFELENNSDKQKNIYLSLDNHPFILKKQLYIAVDNKLKKQILMLNTNRYISYLTVDKKSKLNVYIYIKAQDELKLSVKIYHQKSFIQESSHRQLSAGIAIGGMICFALIQLVWFFASGLKTALLLTGYFITRTLLLATLLGWNINYFLSDIISLSVLDLVFLGVFSSVLFLWFIIELFDLSQRHLKLAKVIRYFCWLNLFYIPLSFFLPTTYNLASILCLHIVESLLLLFSAYLVIKNKERLGNLLAIIAFLQLLFTLLAMVNLLGIDIVVFSSQEIVYYSAFWLNGLLISFLLSRHYYYEIREKETAQRQALANAINSKNAQTELIALQNETQELLEQHVQERTLELNIALQELEAVNQELARKNTLDELTGLHNRRYYDQKIMAEFRRSKRNLSPLSLVIVDIDHFKAINDTYGHQAGDYCLQKLGHIIRASLRRSADVGCRYGGEEFCLILPDTDIMGALEFAENLRLKIGQTPFEYKENILNITISCGVSTYHQQDNATPETLFAAADKALYLAKHNGRNQTWQFAIEDLD